MLSLSSARPRPVASIPASPSFPSSRKLRLLALAGSGPLPRRQRPVGASAFPAQAGRRSGQASIGKPALPIWPPPPQKPRSRPGWQPCLILIMLMAVTAIAFS